MNPKPSTWQAEILLLHHPEYIQLLSYLLQLVSTNPSNCYILLMCANALLHFRRWSRAIGLQGIFVQHSNLHPPNLHQPKNPKVCAHPWTWSKHTATVSTTTGLLYYDYLGERALITLHKHFCCMKSNKLQHKSQTHLGARFHAFDCINQ